ASRGDPRTPIFEGCSPSPLLPSVASAATADLGGFESVGAASAPSGSRRIGKSKGGRGTRWGGGGGGGGGGGSGGGGGGGGSGGGGGGVGSSSGGGGGGGGGGSGGGGGGGGGRGGGGAGRGTTQRSSSGGGQRQQQQRSRETPSPQQLREWYAERQRGGGAGPCTYVLRTGDRAGAFCRAQGIRQTFTLPASPLQNGIAECRIGMVMDVARTSMIHAAAPHFLWPFVVQYAAHQLNLQPRVSLPETSPTLLWTGKVGDASAFRVWGSRAFVRDLSADKLSPRATPCVILGFPPDAPGWQFYHPTSRRVLSSQDVTFDKS
ncbi:unnamed protein product, partial [Closterium sp. NIES-54]